MCGYADLKALVAFSGDLEIDGTTWTEAAANGFAETALPEKFNTSEYQILVVAEKYQTGFDQPKLVAMYVDRKLAGLQAVQTLSRLNRTYAKKDKTFVLDFQNSIEDIKTAFAPYFETTALEERTDLNQIYDLEKRISGSTYIDQSEVERFASKIDDNQSISLTFFSLFMPAAFEPFKQVYLLGDELLQSRFKVAWEKIGGVTFEEADFWKGGRPRDYEIEDRTTIHYFTNDNASFGRFEDEDDPLAAISTWIARKVKGRLLYSCNKRFKPNTDILETGLAEYISPKAHGLNGYQDIPNLVWLAAMRSSGQEYNITSKLGCEPKLTY